MRSSHLDESVVSFMYGDGSPSTSEGNVEKNKMPVTNITDVDSVRRLPTPRAHTKKSLPKSPLGTVTPSPQASPCMSQTSNASFGIPNEQSGFTDIYEIGKCLSGTASSKVRVHEATVLETDNPIGKQGTKVAVKVTSILPGDKNAVNFVRWELKGLEKSGNHPNVLRGYESVIERKGPADSGANGYLVTELCDADLYQATEKPIPYDCVAHLFKQMIAGVQHIHKRGMCHRDIKIENFFLKFPTDQVTMDDIRTTAHVDKFRVKLGDFGFWAKGFDERTQSIVPHYSNCGSDVYSAPEQALPTLSERGYDGCKADIFSLGVCLFVLFCGHPPWNCNRSPSDPYFKLWAKGHVKEYWGVINKHTPSGQHVCPAFRDLVTKMMSVDPEKRPSIENILAHPFVTGQGRQAVVNEFNDRMVPRELSAMVLEGLRVKAEHDAKRKNEKMRKSKSPGVVIE